MNSSKSSTSDNEKLATKVRWEQIGAAGGILFVVLQLLSQMLIQIGGAEPPFNAPAGVIADYFMARNLSLASSGGFLATVSIITFFWFLGALWAGLSRCEGEPSWLSLVAFGSGAAGMAALLGSGGGWELALLRLGEEVPAEIRQLLFDQGNFAFASLWVSLAGLLLASGIVTIRDGALPRWLGWYGLVVAVAFLAARAVWFTASGIKFMPYVLFWIWLIAASIALIRRARRLVG